LIIHHNNEHNQGLRVKTCSFKAQGVLGLSIFVLVFPYPAVPEDGTGKPASVGGFCPFVPCGIILQMIKINCVFFLPSYGAIVQIGPWPPFFLGFFITPN
jgi:hypothetical protein